MPKGEAALRLVELHGGHADVEDHAVDRLIRIFVQPGKGPLHETQPSAGRGLHRLPVADRVGIAVDRNHPGTRREQRARVAAGAERSVDENLPLRRIERPQHLVEKNRNVAGRSATGVVEAAGTRHHSVSPVMRPVVPSCRNRDSRARASVL